MYKYFNFSKLKKLREKSLHERIYREVSRKLRKDRKAQSKFVDHLINGSPLNAEDKELFETYKEIVSLLSNGLKENEVERVMMREKGKTNETVKAWIFDAKLVWGDASDTFNKFERWASITFYQQVSEAAKEAGDLETAIKARKEADKLRGLHKMDNDVISPELFTPDEYTLIPTSEMPETDKLDLDFDDDEEID